VKSDAVVTGLTISNEQLAFARERIEKAGLSDKVDLRFQDYRDETGKYDGIVSIEMFEAVGEKYWPTYFSKVRQCLKPGGKAGLQIITIKPEAYEAYRANPDFIQRYVFPGGMLPTENHLKSLGEAAELEMVGHRAFGPDYGRTLAEWRQRFWACLGRDPADGLRSPLQAAMGILHVLLRSGFPLRSHQCPAGRLQLIAPRTSFHPAGAIFGGVNHFRLPSVSDGTHKVLKVPTARVRPNPG
jgi:hypothetical protein